MARQYSRGVTQRLYKLWSDALRLAHPLLYDQFAGRSLGHAGTKEASWLFGVHGSFSLGYSGSWRVSASPGYSVELADWAGQGTREYPSVSTAFHMACIADNAKCLWPKRRYPQPYRLKNLKQERNSSIAYRCRNSFRKRDIVARGFHLLPDFRSSSSNTGTNHVRRTESPRTRKHAS